MKSLPLVLRTPPNWAVDALSDPVKLLDDHAYLEKKAAINALELLNRWPDPAAPRGWVITLAGIARDETAYLSMVAKLLSKIGGKLSRTHNNPYASALHNAIRKGKGTQELLDRLLISALIEARSCERFGLLVSAKPGEELTKLYRGLGKSERTHFLVFLRLAKQIRNVKEVESRWAELLNTEAEIIFNQPPGPRIHSGWKKS